MRARRLCGFVFAGVVLAMSGCATESGTTTSPTGDLAALQSVSPPGGATSVARAADVVIRFDHPMLATSEEFMTLHHGGVTDSLVPCLRTWSADSLTLTMHPMVAMDSATHYALHLGGGMKDAMGGGVNLGTHGGAMGGQWATGSMMAGGGMMGGGGPMAGQEMGPGWAGANGMYGMIFTFVTQ